jgi:hypothetical protein
MAKTWQNLIDEARELAQDVREPYRSENSTYLNKLNRGLQELGRMRPDAFLTRFDEETGEIVVPEIKETDPDPQVDEDTDDVADATVDAVEALADNVSVPMQFYNALVYFVVGSIEILDEEYSNDGRAAMMMAQFKQSVMGL